MRASFGRGRYARHFAARTPAHVPYTRTDPPLANRARRADRKKVSELSQKLDEYKRDENETADEEH